MKKITSWGKYPLVDANVSVPLTSQSLLNEEKSFISRGLGRSYGDSALSENILVSEQLNHFIFFDKEIGTLCC